MQISHHFNDVVESMMVDGKFGICKGVARINAVKTGNISLKKGPYGDRFKVFIPFAGQTLAWEVIFDHTCPEDPPDFIFAVEDSEFCPKISEIKSLMSWDVRNPWCLSDVISELLHHYKGFQEQFIEENTRLQMEYKTLVQETDLDKNNIELYFSRTERRLGPINLLIKLPIDFTDIPPLLSADNPVDDSAVLLISFPSQDSNKITPQLYLSPRVENALGGSSNLRIPTFPSGGCMLDYVPNVIRLLQNKVEKVAQLYLRRKDFISAFLSNFGRSVLEFDAEGFYSISFLFEWNDFFFILYIELPHIFPQDKPVLTFQSIYHESNDKPYTEVHEEYPYSPRWSSHEMATRIKSYILENIQSFQKESVMSGSLS